MTALVEDKVLSVACYSCWLVASIAYTVCRCKDGLCVGHLCPELLLSCPVVPCPVLSCGGQNRWFSRLVSSRLVSCLSCRFRVVGMYPFALSLSSPLSIPTPIPATSPLKCFVPPTPPPVCCSTLPYHLLFDRSSVSMEGCRHRSTRWTMPGRWIGYRRCVTRLDLVSRLV